MTVHQVRVRFDVEPDQGEDDSEFLANLIAYGMHRSLFLAGLTPTRGVSVRVWTEATVHSDLVPEVEEDLPV
jgi:hypothetical protein